MSQQATSNPLGGQRLSHNSASSCVKHVRRGKVAVQSNL